MKARQAFEESEFVYIFPIFFAWKKVAETLRQACVKAFLI